MDEAKAGEGTPQADAKRTKGVKRGYKNTRKKSGPGKGLTSREKALADLVLAGKTGAQAASEVYNPFNTASASSIASQVLAKPDVRAYLESVSGEAAEIVMKHARGAKSEMVSLIAAKDVLDRTGFKTPEPAKDPNQGATYNFIFSKQTQEEVGRIESIIRARLTGNTHAQEDSQDVGAQPQGPEEAGPAPAGT